MIRDPLAILTVIVAITALAFWLDRRIAWAARVGASLLVLAFGALLSNAGVVPAESVVYDAIVGPVTSLAIAWLLLSVNLRDLRAAGPAMLGAFGIAVLATAVGAVVAFMMLGHAFGDDAWKLAGVMTGTYTGGSVNFVATARAVEFPPYLFAAANAADAVMTAVWLGATLVLPVWLARMFPRPVPEPAEADMVATEHPFFAATEVRVPGLALLLALGLALLLAADGMRALVPGVPAIVWLTTFALAVGHLPVRLPPGSLQLGTLALHFFFAVIGIFSRFAEIMAVGPAVLYFTAIVVLVHGVLVYGGCRLAGIDVGTTSVASQAAVGGPASAMAVAASRGWPALALPGVAAGLLGYAVGTYLGLIVAHSLRLWMAGGVPGF
jgi:uncharacterized membrane protein